MYRCGICSAPSQPKEPLIRLIVPKRDDPSKIAREVPVCRACAKQLQAGASMAEITRTLVPAPTADVLSATAAPQRKTI